MNNLLTCADATPNFLNLFDLTIAPTLLYYSYIPILLLSLLFSSFLLFKERSAVAKTIFLLSVIFSFWMINEIIQWTAIHISVIHFAWKMIAILHLSIFLLGFYLIYLFFFKKYPNFIINLIISLAILPIIVLLPTDYNMIYFDLSECVSLLNNYYSNYIYIVELSILVTCAYLLFSFLKKKVSSEKIFFATSVIAMLTIYFLVSVLGDSFLFYEINLLGPLSIFIFITLLTFSIVKFRTFHIKLLAPQALVFALIFLNFAILFIRSIENVRIIMIFTIIISSILGYMMIRAVKKVDEQRAALDRANRQQTNLLHFISHQVKGFFTKSRNAFAGLLEGDYGPIPETARHIIQEGFDSDNRGVQTVQEILNAANLKTGKTTYSMSDVNIVNIIKDIISLLKPSSDKKSLQVNFNPSVQSLIMKVDTAQITQAFKNLIDNSIKYTPAGKIDITLDVQNEQKQVVIKVVDTGVGIHAEDMPRLFSEGGRGKESLKINVDSTGYGLYIVKNIIEAHGGSVTASSEGEGKGSVFTVVLPVK